MQSPPLKPYAQFCVKQRALRLLRTLPKKITPLLYDFSSNDYLGFSQHPFILQKAIESAQQHGVGSQASRLLSTQQNLLKALETDIATTKNSASALVFSTGFQANLSLLSALFDRRILGTTPLVFADRLNHASLHAGCQLAHVKQIRYAHLDYAHLTWLLEKYRACTQPRFILTESVFGMDGDVADLGILMTLAEKYNAFLYVDEAHATGLFGKQGYGFTSLFSKKENARLISMGTFSKALGNAGAYVTCSHLMKRYFINRCIGTLYSTAPSPMQVGAMHAAWSLVPQYQAKVAHLMQCAASLKQQLAQIGYDTKNTTTHIIPLQIPCIKTLLLVQNQLAKQGIKVSAIRPPTVPAYQSRLRIALSVTHSPEAIQTLTQCLSDLRTMSSDIVDSLHY